MKPYVLIVEDNQIESLKLSKMIEIAGFIPVVVADGFSALDACDKYTIDAALVDIQMPHMDGFSFLERLMKIKKQTPIPIIMMTASKHDTKHVKEAITLGAIDFLVKPIDAQILSSKLSALFSNKSDWSERIINKTQTASIATASYQLDIYSISEMGIRIQSPLPLEKNKFIQIDWAVFNEAGIGPVTLKVIDCDSTENGYSAYLSFLGLSEQHMQKLRQLCLKVGINTRSLDKIN